MADGAFGLGIGIVSPNPSRIPPAKRQDDGMADHPASWIGVAIVFGVALMMVFNRKR